MKKIFSLFGALITLFAMSPNTHAQQNVIGSPVAIEEVTDGMLVAFEARSDADNKGHYLGLLTDQYATAYTTGSEPSMNLIWRLELAPEPNAVTGENQYYLYNMGAGQYARIVWDGNNGGTRYMTSNKEEANAFCFHYSSEGGDNNGYGSGVGSSSNVDWVGDGSAITIVEINDAIYGGSDHFGRGFICNEFANTIAAFSRWWDTNVWTMHRYVDISDPRVALNEYINNLSGTIDDDYKYGTNPGYIADKDKIDEFYTTLYDVIENIDKMTSEECAAAYEKLVEGKTYLDNEASIVQIEDGAYYYFFTANEAFTAVANGNFAIYAPSAENKKTLGWKAFNENEPTFIWQAHVTQDNADGKRYSFRNAGSGLYINKATSKNDSEPVEWSLEYTTPTFLKTFNHAGQWYISDEADLAYPPRPFHQEGHNSGAGTSGRIVLWDGTVNSPSAWFITKVPQEQIDKLASMEGKIELTKTLSQYSGLADYNFEVKDAPGYMSSQEIIDNYRKAYADADTILNYSEGKTFTDEEYAAAGKTLKEAADAFIANRDRGLADGYYRIRVMQTFSSKNDPNYYMNIVEDGKPGWSRAPEANLDQVWKITRIEGNKYSVQNMGNGKYLGKAAQNVSWEKMLFSDAADVPQVITPFNDMIGQFYFTNGVDSLYHYDTGDHLNGTASSAAIRYYDGYGSFGGTAWEFVPVSAEEYVAIEANNEKVTLGYELADALKTAKRLYNSNTVYTTGDNIITSVDQLDGSSCSGDEGLLESLIDDNENTHWASNWNIADAPDAPHYLRFETTDPNGLPDSIIYHAVSRNNGSWHRVPSKLRVSVSNDAENWKELPALLEKNDIADWDLDQFSMTPMNTLVTGVKGYKYIRFEFLAVQPHYEYYWHPVGEYSAVNILPVTGVDEDMSLTQQSSYKNLAAALLSAIKAGQAEVDANAPTEATVELLRKAVAGFNNKAVVDSAVAMAKQNIENLTAGEGIGEFPEAALDTYKEAAQKAIDILEAKGDVATGDDYDVAGKALVEAYNALYPTMVKPEVGKWYAINTAAVDANPDVIMSTRSNYGGYGGHANWSYILGNGNIASAQTDPSANFVFEANEDGTFNLLNVGTGFYNGPETGSGNTRYDYQVICWYEAHPLTIVPFGDGQIGFRMKSGNYIKYNYTAVMNYDANADNEAYNSSFAWRLVPTKDEVEAIDEVYNSTLNQGRIMPITRAFDLQGVPTDNMTGAPLAGYRIVGRETEEGSADSIVTAYKLQRYDDDAVIPAGTPVIYIVEGEYSTEAEKHSITFHAIVDGAVTSVPDTINGLVGQLDAINVPYEYAYPHADSVNVDPAYQQLGYQRAHIAPWLVKELEGEQVDKIIYVKGAGILNGVANIKIEDAKEIVNVYSVDGVLVRRNVKRENAVNGLAKGIYIVGKEKVLVK